MLVGYTGQVSIGHGAFMSVGAYTAANLVTRLGMPFWVAIPAGGLMAALIGMSSASRLADQGRLSRDRDARGAADHEWTINHVQWIFSSMRARSRSAPSCLGVVLQREVRCLAVAGVPLVVLAIVERLDLVRSRIGRTFVAIPDQDIAAEIIGINISATSSMRSRSSFYAGVTGVLESFYLGHRQLRAVPDRRVDRLSGDGDHRRARLGPRFDLGAIFVTLLPIATRWFLDSFGGLILRHADLLNVVPNLRLIIFGGLIIFFLVVEPEG